MKKYFWLLMIPLFFGTGYGMGKKAPSGVSILMVPARPAMIQLGMDMAAQEYALLMSYEPDTPANQFFLHIWDGAKWLRVPASSFQNGSFIKNPASRVLVVGAENKLTAAMIETALEWSPEVLYLGSENVTELINQMGRLYGFKRADWEWIAQRYDLQLEDLGAGKTAPGWYDSNKASQLPPSEKPWKKTQESAPLQTPETSLTPVMPPVSDAAPVESREVPADESAETEVMVEEGIEVDVVEEGQPEPSGSGPVDFSLEME